MTAVPIRTQPLSAEEVLDLAGADLATGDGMGKVLAGARFNTPPNSEERRLAQALAEAIPERSEEEKWEAQRLADTTSVAGSRNPAAVVDAPEPVERVPLSPADLAWIDRLPKNPTEISPEDLRTLTDLAGRAASPGDRRLLETILGPIREHYNRQERREHLKHVIARASQVPQRDRHLENRAISLLADRLRKEIPELTEGEAEGRARQELRDRWDGAERQRQEKLRAAKEQLAELERSYGA